MAEYHMEKAFEVGKTIVYTAYPIKKVLYRGKSRFQDIVVLELPFGKALVLDGIIQFSTYDEHIYHDGLIKPCFEKNYNDILILGGGDGGAAKALIKLAPDLNIKVVDIDPMVTQIVEKYIPEVLENVFSRDNVRLINDDAYSFVLRDDSKYDYILGDLTDLRPEYFEGSEVNKLYTEEFLSLLGSRLNPSGKAVYHVGGLNMDTKLIGLFWRRVRKVFRHVRAYGVYIPSFLDIWVYIAMSNNEFGLSREDPPIIELSYCDKDHIHTPICYLKK